MILSVLKTVVNIEYTVRCYKYICVLRKFFMFISRKAVLNDIITHFFFVNYHSFINHLLNFIFPQADMFFIVTTVDSDSKINLLAMKMKSKLRHICHSSITLRLIAIRKGR